MSGEAELFAAILRPIGWLGIILFVVLVVAVLVKGGTR